MWSPRTAACAAGSMLSSTSREGGVRKTPAYTTPGTGRPSAAAGGGAVVGTGEGAGRARARIAAAARAPRRLTRGASSSDAALLPRGGPWAALGAGEA
jgi:hypothetical protein